MFKLAALTALIATSAASAATTEAKDKAAMDKDASTLKASAEKYNSTPGAKVWSEVKKTGKYKFMSSLDAVDYTAIPAKAKVSDLSNSCQLCFMTGNIWTAKDGKVAAKCEGADAEATAAEAAMDYTLTYK